jgi:hypothetical protein
LNIACKRVSAAGIRQQSVFQQQRKRACDSFENLAALWRTGTKKPRLSRFIVSTLSPTLQEELRRQNGLSPWAWIKESHMTSSGRDSMLTQWPSEEWKTIAALLYLFRMGKVHAESYLAIYFLGNYLTTRAGTEARVREHDCKLHTLHSMQSGNTGMKRMKAEPKDLISTLESSLHPPFTFAYKQPSQHTSPPPSSPPPPHVAALKFSKPASPPNSNQSSTR